MLGLPAGTLLRSDENMADFKPRGNPIRFGPFHASGNRWTWLGVVMNNLSFQLPEHLESSRKHDEELEHLLNGIQAWCVAPGQSFNSVQQDEDRSGKRDD
jgi:hypothetical protein